RAHITCTGGPTARFALVRPAMVQLPIKRAIERIPGGMMIVPLFAGALLRTFAPGTPTFFGSFTGALFTGALTILAVVVGIVLGRFWGETPVEGGILAGLSTLAVVAAMNDTNGGLYMALIGQFGSPRDVAAYSIMSIESGPFLTMVTLGVAGLSAFPWQALVGAILPLAVGMVLGNLDEKMRAFLAPAVPVLFPFFAFALGANIDLGTVWKAGLLGIGLGIFVVLVTGTVLFFTDRITGGTGTAGLAAASTAGNA